MLRNQKGGFVGIIVLVIVGFMALSVLATAFNLITIPWLTFSSKVQTNRDIVTKTFNADNALYNYHWFKERSEAIKALDTTIGQSVGASASFEASAGPRSSWTFEDKSEFNRLNAVTLGQKAQYNSLVGEYNARAKEVDRAVFQDELPLFFNLK